MSNPAEMIDIYDDNRNFTGITLPRKQKLTTGQYMMYVYALIQDLNEKFLITQRALDKKWAPGAWEVPGGGAMAGESSYQAICREIIEETGLDISCDEASVISSYKNTDEKHGDNYFADIYLVKKDFTLDDINLDAKEVTGMKLATLDEIKALKESDGFLHYERICDALSR